MEMKRTKGTRERGKQGQRATKRDIEREKLNGEVKGKRKTEALTNEG